MNKRIFKIIQIPFNICDNRWKNLALRNKIIIRSIFLQGVFFCEDKNIPIKIRPEIKRIKKKINFFIRKFKRLDIKDLLLNYVKSFNFKGIIIGVDNEKQLKELFFYANMPRLKKYQIHEIEKSLKPCLNVIDPRKWN